MFRGLHFYYLSYVSISSYFHLFWIVWMLTIFFFNGPILYFTLIHNIGKLFEFSGNLEVLVFWFVFIFLGSAFHYKEFCPYQPTHLQLMSKSTIFSTIVTTIRHGTMVKTTCSCKNNFKMVYSCKCNYDLQLMSV